MQPTSQKPAEIVRSLLRRSRQGALATLMPGSGDPYCSLVNVATAPDGAPILLISRLALHTRNILADARVSLMLDERGPGDPLEGARIMLAGVAEEIPAPEAETLRRRYLAAHPSAETFVDFPDFRFFALRLRNAHLVAGFGKIVDLPAADFLTATEGAESLLAAEPDIVAHMNADHLGTMNLYATALLGADPGDWRCTGCDPDGLDMQNGSRILRLAFPISVQSPVALQKILKGIADRARASSRDV
jgi:putative heme iron utilization protein